MDVLAVIDRGIFEPCEVTLRVSDSDVRTYACESSFRLLPGRRLTALASHEGKKYVIKIFPRRRRSLDEYESELAGHEQLHSASILTAPIVYRGPAAENVNIIIYKYMLRARTLLEVFEKKPTTRLALKHLDQFAQLIAQMHRSQLVHEDPHLGNFLLKGDEITVLDSGAVRRVGNMALAERNYGLFVAQFPVSWNIDRRFYRAYRGDGKRDEMDFDHLQKQVRASQQWRERHYLKKIYRECTQFHVISTLFGKMVIDRHDMHTGLIELLDDPGSMFDGDGVEMLKEGNSSTVGMVKLRDKRFVIKRYNVKGRLHLLKQLVRESRASRSWRNAHRMTLRGFPTARPVALLECLKGRFKGVSVYVMEYVEGVNSANYFLDPQIDSDSKRAVAKNLLSMISEMHQERLLHGDLKSTNFIVSDQGLVVVDLDAMKVASQQTNMKAAIAREMKRFAENWHDNAEAKAIFEELMQDKAGAKQ
jgi:tRNA A-37 threonylcarbamoyl transferase component Bud32